MIEINIIQKKYPDFSIEDVSLSVFPGEITLLLGHNGSGKTTIIRSLLGLVHLDLGNIKLDNIEINFQNYNSYEKFKSDIRFIPDEDVLFDYLTPVEYFQLVTISNDIDSPDFLDFLINVFDISKYTKQLISTLSHGNRKKVQIIGQILCKPKYLIIDEPTNGLDPDMIIILKQIILKLRDLGTGILISTHDLRFAENLMNNVTIIRNGKIILQDKSDNLLKEYRTCNLEDIYKKINNDYYNFIEELIENEMVKHS
ncbi:MULTISPECIES: ATP-binding cassette domain-containing protein [Lysinibacillus]|uniref:ATP-binding cassette domain-containing protein n=1 Tax=Lysinibacillus TaxID=400634 RepID=UPI001CC1AB21|nr:ABC transporter ATP-binding protein [Lysinibacillus sphaericus]